MTRRRVLIGAALFIGVSALAYALADEVRDYILAPLAYQLWYLGQLYHTLPQQFVWLVIVLLVMYLSLSIFYGAPARATDDQKRRDQRGPVEALAAHIDQRHKGIYFKWQIAYLLAEVAVRILDFQQRRFPGRRLAGKDWTPPPQVEALLDAGLNTSFADYPRPGLFEGALLTPLDIDLEPVVAFLESELEMDQHDSHHS